MAHEFNFQSKISRIKIRKGGKNQTEKSEGDRISLVV
jgi:hypothetical protein